MLRIRGIYVRLRRDSFGLISLLAILLLCLACAPAQQTPIARASVPRTTLPSTQVPDIVHFRENIDSLTLLESNRTTHAPHVRTGIARGEATKDAAKNSFSDCMSDPRGWPVCHFWVSITATAAFSVAESKKNIDSWADSVQRTVVNAQANQQIHTLAAEWLSAEERYRVMAAGQSPEAPNPEQFERDSQLPIFLEIYLLDSWFEIARKGLDPGLRLTLALRLLFRESPNSEKILYRFTTQESSPLPLNLEAWARSDSKAVKAMLSAEGLRPLVDKLMRKALVEVPLPSTPSPVFRVKKHRLNVGSRRPRQVEPADRDPVKDYSNVSSLRPELAWKWTPYPVEDWFADGHFGWQDIRYDLRAIESRKGEEKYFVSGLPSTRHKLEKRLAPCRLYKWEVRATFMLNNRWQASNWQQVDRIKTPGRC